MTARRPRPRWTPIPTGASRAHVINIVPTADRQKATVRVRIGFDTLDPRILPDMGVKVRFMQDLAAAAARPGNIALVPTGALVKDGDRDAVWTIVDGRAQRRVVKAGNVREGNTEVLEGVRPGDLLIAAPPATLTEGARVRVAATAGG